MRDVSQLYGNLAAWTSAEVYVVLPHIEVLRGMSQSVMRQSPPPGAAALQTSSACPGSPIATSARSNEFFCDSAAQHQALF